MECPAWLRRALWLVVSSGAIAWLLSKGGASLMDGDYIPFGYDSFYHASRILDAAIGGEAIRQFEPRMHFPNGLWITWPWGYDWLLAQYVRAALALGVPASPMAILAHVPLIGLCLNLALVLAVAKELRLGAHSTALCAIVIVGLPRFLMNHAVGAVDHHWAELLALLLALWTGLRWQRVADVRAALLHGAVLGSVPALQNGLFLLQAFTLLALAQGWALGGMPPRRSVAAFAGALVLAAALVAIPSQPAWNGLFAFYYLGWFHVSVAVGTALLALVMTWQPATARGAMVMALATVVVGGLLFAQVRVGTSFVLADTRALASIQETASVFEKLRTDGVRRYVATNSWVPLLAPLFLIVVAWRARHAVALRWLLAYGLVGCGLYLLQVRFWSFGLVPAVLAFGVALEWALSRSSEGPGPKWIATGLAAALALCLSVFELLLPFPHGGSYWLSNLRPLLPALREACRDAPRVVLADPNYGHFITYFTRCTVVANNFIIAPGDYEVLARSRRWFELAPEAFRSEAVGVDYVVADVHPGRREELERIGRLAPGSEMAPLKRRLLDERAPLPPGYEIAAETATTVDGRRYATMRLMRVLPAP